MMLNFIIKIKVYYFDYNKFGSKMIRANIRLCEGFCYIYTFIKFFVSTFHPGVTIAAELKV